MKKPFLFTILLSGIALTGCNRSTQSETAATDTMPVTTDQTAATTPVSSDTYAQTEAASRNAANDVAAAGREVSNDVSRGIDNAAASMRSAGRDAANAMSQASRDASAKLNEWKLSAQDIEADLAANNPIVRTNTSAGAPTGRLDEDALEESIKAKFKGDTELATHKFDVNVDGKGAVELEGKAASADQVGKAIALALSTEGVTKVTSKIKLDKDAGR